MNNNHATAGLPDIFRADLVPLEAEIAALEALQLGLDGTMKRMLDEVVHQRDQLAGLSATSREPQSMDFPFVGDFHEAHSKWQRAKIERENKHAELIATRDRASSIYTEFADWIVRPAQARLEQLRAQRDEIVRVRGSLCNAAMKAAWKGGMSRTARGSSQAA